MFSSLRYVIFFCSLCVCAVISKSEIETSSLVTKYRRFILSFNCYLWPLNGTANPEIAGLEMCCSFLDELFVAIRLELFLEGLPSPPPSPAREGVFRKLFLSLQNTSLQISKASFQSRQNKKMLPKIHYSSFKICLHFSICCPCFQCRCFF